MKSYLKSFIFLGFFLLTGSYLAIGQTFNTLKKADDDFASTNFYYALQNYLKVYDKNTENTAVVEKIMLCNKYLHNFNDVLTWSTQLVKLEPHNAAYQLEHARAQQSLGKYVDAKNEYQEYLKQAPTEGKKIREYIRSCDSGLKWTRHPDLSVTVRNVAELNTPYSEFGLTKFGAGYMFASDRKSEDSKLPTSPKKAENQEIFGFTGRPYLKLYYANPVGDSSWEKPSFFSKLMTEKYHTSNASYDEVNNILYFTRTRKVEVPKSFSKSVFRAELVYSEAFREIKPFPFNSSLDYSCGDPCICRGGNRIYFSSGAPGGQGGQDLYYSDKAADGTWKTPVNLGPKINTPGEERYPTIYNDSILYFSSDGHSGMGGLDIFTTTLQPNGKWSPVRNLGAPFNSPQDDFFLTITAIQKIGKGKTVTQGYFSSDRIGGKGSDDIYFFKTGELARPIMVADAGSDTGLVAKGKILDQETGSGISGVNLAVKDITKPEVRNFQTDSSGSFAIPVKRSKTYAIRFKKPKFFTKTDTLSVPASGKTGPINLNVKIEPMVVDKPVRLDNIYFAFNSWDINSKSAEVLDGLVKQLSENPGVDIEIASHTDTRGDFVINKYISQQRAQSVVAYLISKGVDPHRLTSKGYGKERPLVRCGGSTPCTEADHAQNRRTEFKIVKISDSSTS